MIFVMLFATTIVEHILLTQLSYGQRNYHMNAWPFLLIATIVISDYTCLYLIGLGHCLSPALALSYLRLVKGYCLARRLSQSARPVQPLQLRKFTRRVVMSKM